VKAHVIDSVWGFDGSTTHRLPHVYRSLAITWKKEEEKKTLDATLVSLHKAGMGSGPSLLQWPRTASGRLAGLCDMSSVFTKRIAAWCHHAHMCEAVRLLFFLYGTYCMQY
jgi:hypothetical protein